MKQIKATIILLLIIVSGSLIACGKNKNENNTLERSTYTVNNFKDASISVVKDSITNRSISVKVSYTGDNTGILGSWFSVEIYKDDQWCIIPDIIIQPIRNRANVDKAHIPHVIHAAQYWG